MYKSKAQQGFFHANEDEIGEDVVKEFDEKTKGKYKDLPEKVAAKKGAGPVMGASCCGKPGCAAAGMKKRAGSGY